MLGLAQAASNASSASGDRQQTPKRQRQEGSRKGMTEETLQQLCENTAKLTLSNAQTIRALAPSVYETFLVDENGQRLKALKRGTVNYTNLVNENAKKEKPGDIGVPALHAWSELLAEMKTVNKENTERMKMLEEYTQLVGSWGTEVYNELDRQVHMCRIGKAFQKGYKKLQVSVLPGTPSRSIWDQVCVPTMKEDKKGVRRLTGCAPRGNLERTLQDILDRHADRED
eukprot:TRINITY_DN81537_c0_g1_i1.p2 TRINITY_DN81537_c0_g1~~TRINITY_DN81537_c0_g1_i1.p2  ORF type:complete len:228 (+),score=57.23 TRINITY_DN81537_c0_g1_i1:46-729(+)